MTDSFALRGGLMDCGEYWDTAGSGVRPVVLCAVFGGFKGTGRRE